MAEYIEREQAINFARSSAAAAYNRDDFGAYRGLNAFISTLVQIPAADAAPVVHGHWISVNPPKKCVDWLECSECGYKNFYFCKFKFCPICGAKMDEEDNHC